jgi:hypothetical protein
VGSESTAESSPPGVGSAQPVSVSADNPAMLAPLLLLLALTNDPELLAELAELLEAWQPEAEA